MTQRQLLALLGGSIVAAYVAASVATALSTGPAFWFAWLASACCVAAGVAVLLLVKP